jgi:hypothetical protein
MDKHSILLWGGECFDGTYIINWIKWYYHCWIYLHWINPVINKWIDPISWIDLMWIDPKWIDQKWIDPMWILGLMHSVSSSLDGSYVGLIQYGWIQCGTRQCGLLHVDCSYMD